MHVSDFTVINWPLLEAVELEEMTVKGNVADEMEGLGCCRVRGDVSPEGQRANCVPKLIKSTHFKSCVMTKIVIIKNL